MFGVCPNIQHFQAICVNFYGNKAVFGFYSNLLLIVDEETFHAITEEALISKLLKERLPDEQLEELIDTLCSQYKDIFIDQTP